MRRPIPIVLALVAVASAGHAWQATVAVTPPDSRPHAVAVDAAGDAVAAGRVVAAGGDEDALVVGLAAENGLELWRRQTAGSGGGNDLYRAVTTGAGGVVAVGRVTSATAGGDALMTRLDPDGDPVWQVTFDGGAAREDDAMAVALDGAGNAVVAGESTPMDSTQTSFAVWKRQASDGAPLWLARLDDDAGIARAVVVDGDDVVAAGEVGQLAVVARFDGDGQLLWRRDVAGSIDATDSGRAVAVGGGRVVVAARMIAAGGNPDFAVVAIDAATGAELWRVVLDGSATGENDEDDALGIAVDAAGDVLAVGQLSDAATDADAMAVKLAGATGDELWRTLVNGRNSNDDVFQAVALDGAGDLLVTGTIRNPGSRADFLVGKLANATGAELWRHEIDGVEHAADTGAAVAAGPTGDLFAAGRLRNGAGEDGFVVVRRAGGNGGDFPCGDGTPDPGEECDDGNATPGDGCRAGCTLEICGDGIHDPQEGCDDGNTVAGDCCSATCAQEPDDAPCDDFDACTLDEACQAGACTPAEQVICTPATPCHLGVCDPADGSCSSVPKAEGAPCNDSNACTVLDQCVAAVCTGSVPVQCNDAEPCTRDGCSPASGCEFTPLEGFDSITCAFLRPNIATACGAGVPGPIDRRIRAAKGRIARAALAEQPGRARRALRVAVRNLEKALRLADRQRRRGKLDATCAAVLDVELGETVVRTQAVRDGLGT